MGVCLSTFAIKQKAPEAVHQIFRVRATGQRGTFPEHRFSGTMLPTDWYLVCQWKHEFSNTEMQKLSQSGEVVGCFVEEHVMVSKAAGWKDGRQLWSVTHELEKDSKHLDVQGTPPSQFARIRDDLFAKQTAGDCDYIFDIPVALAADLTGFRYDKRPDTDFEVLKRSSLLGIFWK